MKKYLVFIVLVILTACSQEKSESPIKTATPGGVLNQIPSFAAIEMEKPPALIPPDDPRFPIEPDPAGKAIYEANCAECHGINGEGQFPDDPYKPNEAGLIGAPPHNSDGHTWHHPDHQLFEVVHRGRSFEGFQPMPAFGDKLTEEEIFVVLAYIKTFWGEQELEVQYGVTEAARQH